MLAPARNWVIALWRAAQVMAFGDGLYIAGYMAYTGLFALFPFLIFIVSLAGFIGSPESAQQVIDLMFQYVPEKVASTLAPAVQSVLTVQRGGLLTVGIVGTIWVASGGVSALRVALNDAYEITDRRSVFTRYLQSIVFVIAGAFSVLILSVAIIFGPVLWRLALALTPIDPANVVIWDIARYATAIAVVTGGLIVVHRFLPGTPLPIRGILPGALLTVVLWLGAASGFSFYLAYATDYDLTYGGLGGVALTLLFFYLTGVLFIYGAAFNMELMKASGTDIWRSGDPSIRPVISDDRPASMAARAHRRA